MKFPICLVMALTLASANSARAEAEGDALFELQVTGYAGHGEGKSLLGTQLYAEKPSTTARRYRRNTLTAFKPLRTKSASVGSNASSKPASACSIRDDAMHTSQSSKRDA